MDELSKIYDILAAKDFQNPETGKLFFPVYIYSYDPKQEYAFRKGLTKLKRQLARPSNYLDTMVLDVWQSLLEYLKEYQFGNKTLYQLMIAKEKKGEDITQWIRKQIANPTRGYYPWLEQKVIDHFSEDTTDKRAYLLVHGLGAAYPYLRASGFLKNSERFVKNYKMILFYPGTVRKENFSLFGQLDDDNIYRANNLNQFIANENNPAI